MKTFAILLFSFLMTKGCQTSEKKDMKAAIIEYVANTRGFYQKIEIKDNTASVSHERSGKEKPTTIVLSKEDSAQLAALLEDIDFEDLKNLKAPTEKRFYDGAAIANLKITYKDKTYQSASFDHGFPPAEIEKIVLKINSFAKQNNEN
ncbi:hypothetical protein FFWV33_04925 [Flavobacterium faecale]|uniref:Uncharacterized protein n=1 Tax=Flavobacterium faecale TaxID=1355330 RepID=A0A2S1LAZ7_9FLAO|nr:hypothetical protein [Flavobacterium faecale]AWG20930.1 hypothetical protein FFWV33_04925 [Flavobacterium faecale]